MPFPPEYQRATDDFYTFLQDVRDASFYGSSHQSYTTVQAVFQVFRRRVSLEDGVRFATCLPVGLRALFVAEWDPDEPRRPFGTVEEMTAEALTLRPDHNFVNPDSIAVVSAALWRHVDATRLQATLARMDPAAREYWDAGSDVREDPWRR